MCDVWYRSLYWRISFGIIAFLAMMLAAQGFLFAGSARTDASCPRCGTCPAPVGIGTASS